MNFIELSKEQRKLYGEKLLDLSHFIFAGLVIGQFFSGEPFSFDLAAAGLLLTALLYWWCYQLTNRRK